MTHDKKKDADLAIIFDLGRVLVDVDFTRGLFKYYHSDQFQSKTEIIERIFKDDLFIAFTTGKLSPQKLYKDLIQRYNLHLSYDQYVQEWCDIFSPMEGMDILVKEIAACYPVGLLSDTDPLHWDYCLRSYPFLRIFNKPTLSYEIGALKPNPICYLTAAENVGKQPSRCFFIDDREKNVAGARRAGMQSLQFTGVDDLKSELSKMRIL